MIANGVKSHREELNLTQAEYAKRAGVGRRTIQRWEAGRSVRRSYVQGAADSLGVPLSRLLHAPGTVEVIEPAKPAASFSDFLRAIAQLLAWMERKAATFAEALAHWREVYASDRDVVLAG